MAGINYKETPDFSKLVMEMTNGHGADIILDPVMGSNFNFNLDCLAMDATWVLYGSMGGVNV